MKQTQRGRAVNRSRRQVKFWKAFRLRIPAYMELPRCNGRRFMLWNPDA